MFYVGLDIHTKHISICALNDTGQVAHRSRVRSIEEMMQILKGLPDRFEVCYEASCGYGHFHDLLQPLAARVLVAHPGQLRLIFRSKNKNDRNDAERLAKLLYLGETPTVHVPSLEVRTWRELINCRSQVIAKRTRAKNAVRALLRSAGVIPPRQPGLWTKKGLTWLRQVALPTTSQQLRRDLLLEEIETLIRQVRRIEQQLNRQAQHTSAVARLRTIPGVGIRTAEAVWMIRTAFAMPKRSVAISVWCRARTSRATGIGSGTSLAKARRSCDNWSPRRPGKRNADHRPYARISSAPSAAIRNVRRSRW
jgi:transposase